MRIQRKRGNLASTSIYTCRAGRAGLETEPCRNLPVSQLSVRSSDLLVPRPRLNARRPAGWGRPLAHAVGVLSGGTAGRGPRSGARSAVRQMVDVDVRRFRPLRDPPVNDEDLNLNDLGGCGNSGIGLGGWGGGQANETLRFTRPSGQLLPPPLRYKIQCGCTDFKGNHQGLAPAGTAQSRSGPQPEVPATSRSEIKGAAAGKVLSPQPGVPATSRGRQPEGPATSRGPAPA